MALRVNRGFDNSSYGADIGGIDFYILLHFDTAELNLLNLETKIVNEDEMIPCLHS